MSIFDIFRTDKPASVATSEQISQPQPIQTQQIQQPQPASAPQPDELFKDLWNTNNDQDNSSPQLNFDLDQSKLAEIAGKIDYTAVITPEMRAKIAEGGESAMAATVEAINAANRLSYQANAISTSKLIEAAVKNTEASLEKKIQDQFKSLGLREKAVSNPALSNPAFKPLVDSARSQILRKFPDATTDELNEKLNLYLNQAAAAFAPDMAKKALAPVGQVPQNEDSFDWSSWLTN